MPGDGSLDSRAESPYAVLDRRVGIVEANSADLLEGIFRISGRSMSPVTIAPGVVRLVVAVLVPYCLPQGRVPRRLVPDQCDQRALPPPTRTSAHHR